MDGASGAAGDADLEAGDTEREASEEACPWRLGVSREEPWDKVS